MAERRHPGFAARAWIERLIAPLPAGAAILDLGCGGGEPIGRFLLDRGFAVTGVDAARSMIELARTRLPHGSWIQGDMRTVALDGVFDVVVAWNALTWLGQADQARMMTRSAAWLGHGGHLLFNAGSDRDPARDDYRSGTPYRADLEAVDYRTEIARCELIEIAHAAADATSGGADIWLARKP